MHRPVRQLAIAVLLAGVSCLPAALTVAPAGAAMAAAGQPGAAGRAATTLGDAQARARALRAAVDALQTKAELATEAYNAAYEALGQAVTANLVAQSALDRATLSVGTAGRTADRRVRALYMSGGAPALYATVLQGSSINDIFERLASVRAVVGGDRLAADAAAASVVDKAAAEQRLAALADRQTRLEAAVASRAGEVRSLLASTTALLSQADAQVRQLADDQRRAAEAAAAAAAQAALARARQSAGGAALPTGGANPPTAAAAVAIAEAERHLGQPYLWGGTGPAAYDCSGLTMTAYRAAGVYLPRTAAQQYSAGQPVGLAELAPGDLLFWASDLSNAATIHHVAIYLGNGQMIAAPHTGAFVRIEPVYLDGFFGAVRPVPVPAATASPSVPVVPGSGLPPVAATSVPVVPGVTGP